MHRETYRAYWSPTRFLMQLEDPESPKVNNFPGLYKAAQLHQHLQRIAVDDLAHVKTLRAIASTCHLYWAYDDGVWTFWQCAYPTRTTLMRRASQEIWIEADDLEKSSNAMDLEA